MKRCAVIALCGIILLFVPIRAADPKTLTPPDLTALAARSIGPANMSGRITAVAVVANRPAVQYISAASGGLWKTVNNGTTWTPVFEDEKSASIGDVAVAPSNPDIVWVGTGEANARNSVSWGDGVYKSTNAGKTWKNMGLRDSHHIGRVVIHPKNPDVVYVAALGHVWGPNKERGLYKTTDGGKTWEQIKYPGEDTGFIDLVMDPSDPETLYAAAFKVRRDAFSGGNPATQFGPDAGLYKTTDGGKTWDRLTKGLPDRPLGRCGIDVCRKDPRVLYAVVPTDQTDIRVVAGQPAKTNDKPEKGGIFRSADKGATWVKVNDLCPRPFYFGQVRIDPNDPQRLFVLGVTLFMSDDGGKTFRPDAAPSAHADHHALWIDPADSDHMVLGCDGGLNYSYDRGKNWEHLKNLPIGQFYAIGLDACKPYHVYGGLQDNGTWGGPSRTANREGIGTADWSRIHAADGFYCQVDPADPETVYCEGQYGNLRRIHVRLGTDFGIRPQPPADAPAYRFNWSSPILLSPHNARTLYFGGNHVFKSVNRGDKWEVISPDLTRGKPGPSPYNGHTITALAESPLKAGLLYAGTDDGRVHVSHNGGAEWTDVSAKVPDVPAERWVTRIECSPFAEGTAYLSLDRHRNDDRAPYLFKTEDYGATWKSITANLPPGGPVHVVRADPVNRNLLYVGTEYGLFVSLDGGTAWQPFRKGLPTVEVHDLAVHPRDRELVIATHGRSLYIMDVAPLQQLSAKVLSSPVHLFDVKPALAYQPRGHHGVGGGKTFLAPNPPAGAALFYYLKDKTDEEVHLSVTDALGKSVAVLDGPSDAGLHCVQWDLRGRSRQDEGPVPAGEYIVRIKVGGREMAKKVRVEAEE
jgi:photosystem II stability/assembly factor-like uncharacterized protein